MSDLYDKTRLVVAKREDEDYPFVPQAQLQALFAAREIAPTAVERDC